MDLHVEAARAPRDPLSDPAHAIDAHAPSGHLKPDQLGRVPARPGARPKQFDALGRPARGAEHKQHRGLGNRIGEDVGRVEHAQPARLCRGEIDVLMADRISAEDLHRWRQRSDRSLVHPVGGRDDESARTGARLGDLGDAHGPAREVEGGIAARGHQRPHLGQQRHRDEQLG